MVCRRSANTVRSRFADGRGENALRMIITDGHHKGANWQLGGSGSACQM